MSPFIVAKALYFHKRARHQQIHPVFCARACLTWPFSTCHMTPLCVCISLNEPFIVAKEPYISAKEPYISAKERPINNSPCINDFILIAYECLTWLFDVCDKIRMCVWHDSFILATWLIFWHDTFIWVMRLIHMRDMTYLEVWQDSFTCVTQVNRVCHMTDSSVWYESCHTYGWVISRIHMCDMTHSCVWPGSFICVIWLIRMFDATHAFMYVTWLMHMGDKTLCYSFIWGTRLFHMCDTWLLHVRDKTRTCGWKDSCILIHISDMTDAYVWRDSSISVTWFVELCDLLVFNGVGSACVCVRVCMCFWWCVWVVVWRVIGCVCAYMHACLSAGAWVCACGDAALSSCIVRDSYIYFVARMGMLQWFIYVVREYMGILWWCIYVFRNVYMTHVGMLQ